ncbi:MAG: BspA family leucine-rich repeat surface protein, partial [Ekhidna sp.]|nr:BspA family leucine-rich repeat surface protein [Ekhidna sp.]
MRSIQKWGDNPWTSMNSAFRNCNNLTIDEEAGIPNLSKVTDMSYMFAASALNEDISEWDVSNVTNMEGMFAGTGFNRDLSKWDISSVKNMELMFWSNSAMSSENYDKLLIGWSTLDTDAGETKIPSGITFGAPDKYSCRGKAGRDILTGATPPWTITGDELIPIRTDAAALSAVTAQCEVTANDLTAPTAKNKCDGTGTKVTAMHNIPNDAFPITESSLITWTYTDNGKSIVQTQAVTIADTEAPRVIGNLAPVTAQCPINAENELTEPHAPADNCGGTVTVALKSGTSFPIQAATNTITWVYTDEDGNS